MGTVQSAGPLIRNVQRAEVDDRFIEHCSLLLERALASTGAVGATISLVQNNAMVTCARAGSSVPSPGSRLRVEGDLATMCVRTGSIQRSDDAEIDQRVDSIASRALGVRSIVSLPVRCGERVRGVLTMFHTRRSAFSPGNVAVLQEIAGLVGIALDEQEWRPPGASHERPAELVSRARAIPDPPQALERKQLSQRELEPDARDTASPQYVPASTAESSKILRFLKSERLLHWSIAIPFIVCLASATILVVFYNPHPQREFRLVFSWIHKLSGICLALLPPLVLVTNYREYKTHVHNIRHGWGWRLDDFKWLILMVPAAITSRVSLPEQGKFNAAEKLNFMMVMSSFPLFVTTGILLWTPGIHFVPWLAHVGMALLTVPLVLGHMFMATVNPSTRVGLDGMLSGYVDRNWAMHHYRRWYRDNFEESPKDQRPKSCTACSRPTSKPWGRSGMLGLNVRTCPKCGAEVTAT